MSMKKFIILGLIGLVGCGDKTSVTNVYGQPQSLEPLSVSSLSLESAVYTELGWIEDSGCLGLVTFLGDFSIYSNFSGSFFDSIKESIFVNEADQTVELLDATTGHKNLKFEYDFDKASGNWAISYGPQCSRWYRRL